MVSVILPVYNEKKTVTTCLSSIIQQKFKEFELIVINDGSTDGSEETIERWMRSLHEQAVKINIRLLSQNHQGPAKARNHGARYASGNVLVFIDADMTFDENFIVNLTFPILDGESKGTFTKEEYVSNWDNIWARCWNYNQGIDGNRRVLPTYPSESPVFRAILTSEFNKVQGFDDIGFTDDWSLSRKLMYKATLSKGAVCYHSNPESLLEVYTQARWIGKNEFISGSLIRRITSIIRFNVLVQFLRGIWIALKFKEFRFLIFQLVYYTGISISVLRSFLGENKNK